MLLLRGNSLNIIALIAVFTKFTLYFNRNSYNFEDFIKISIANLIFFLLLI